MKIKRILITILLVVVSVILMTCFTACDNNQQNEPHTHSFEEWSTSKKASCIEAGEEERYCSCGEKQVRAIAALGHTEVVDEAIESTCKVAGKTEGKHCSVCGYIIIEQKDIPLSNHTYDSDNDTDCNICGYVRTESCKHINTEVIPSVDASCTQIGLTEGVKCIDCGTTIVAQTIVDAKNHNPITIKGYDSTCSQVGRTDGIECSACGSVIEKSSEIPVKPHEYSDKYDESCNKCGFTRDAECAHIETTVIPGKEATCTEAGLTAGSKCNKCSEIIIAQTNIAKLGHVEVIDAAVDATCTSSGKTEGKHCQRCNAILVSQTTTDKLGHIEVVDYAVNATCTTDGKTEGKHCSRCNMVLVQQSTVDKLNHLEVVVGGTPASCTTDGTTDGKYCSRCHVTLVESTVINKLGHNEAIDTGNPATCTSDGLTNGKHCTRCGIVTITQSVIKASGHTISGANCSSCNKTCEELCVNFYDMSYASDGSVMGYVIENWESKGSYHFYVVGAGKMKDYSASKSPIKLDGYSTKITQLTISSGVTSIGNYTFEFCDYISSVNIPSTVTSIGHQAFYECDGLSEIKLSENIKYVGSNAFYRTAHYDNSDNWYRNVYYVDGVVVDAKSTISGNHTLKAGTKTIVERAFDNCSELTGITIPNTVVAINSYAFEDCTKLATVTFEANSKCETIGYWAFYGAKIKTITIPKSVHTIDAFALYGCSSLESIEVEQGNLAYKSIDGVLFNYDVTNLLLYPRASSKTEYVVPATVTKIEKWAFGYASKLTTVTISTNVKEIGAYAFCSCSNLKTAIFENPVGWTMYQGSETIEMTESRMENAALYLTHEGMYYYQYAWMRE